MFDEEVGKYRKKSTAKGQPRSKHKHEYQTVLLQTYYTFNVGTPKTHVHEAPTRVCIICGRIDYIDDNPDYYISTTIPDIPFRITHRSLSEKARSLTKYKANAFDKTAIKVEE